MESVKLRNRGVRTSTTLALLIGCALFGATGNAQTLFRIGSGGSGGTYFPIADLIAKAISRLSDCATESKICRESGLLAVAQASNGSVANVRDLGNRRLEAGLVQADIAYKAYKGEDVFGADGAYSGLRAVANLYAETVHLVVRKDSEIHSAADLVGRRVSLEEPGSGSLLSALLILRAYGLRESDLRSIYVNSRLAAQMMRKGELDAFFVVAGYPAAAVAELAAGHDIRLVPIADPQGLAITEAKSYFSTAEIPAGVYAGVQATATLGVGAQLLVDVKLDERVAYRLTRALWDRSTREAFLRSHPQGRQIRLENAIKGVAIPMHPGAERYYREVGLLVEEY